MPVQNEVSLFLYIGVPPHILYLCKCLHNVKMCVLPQDEMRNTKIEGFGKEEEIGETLLGKATQAVSLETQDTGTLFPPSEM